MVTAPIPDVAFSPPPVPHLPVPPPELIDGGPVAAMHRDIKARLMRAFPPVQFTHRTMPARLTPEGWARLTERLPMVALGWLKMTPQEGRAVRGRVWSGRSHWTIFLVCKNPEIEAQLLGDALGVGMLGMLAVATAALHGHSIAGITGYLTSNAGVADAAWLDVMTPSTMSAIRYDWKNYVELVYPQAKLFDDDSIGAEYDNTAVTPKRMRASWAKRCLDYERAGWIEGSATTVQQGSFQRNASDKNRLDQDVVVTICGNLIVEATVLEFTA